MNNRTKPVSFRWIFLLSGMVGGSLALLGCSGEFTEEEVEVGYRGEASRNPFLAAQRLCEHYGVSSKSRPSLGSLPPPNTTLALSQGGITSRGGAEVIKKWVTAGGSLIYFLRFLDRSYDDFAEVSPEINFWGSEDSQTDFLLDSFKVLASPGPERSRPSVSFQGQPYEVKFPSNLVLDFEPQTTPRTGLGTASSILQFSFGEGEVILVADAYPFRNRQIGYGDHAALFWAMINQTGNADFLIVYGADLSFLGLLWSRGWMVIIPILLAIAMWIWKNIPRDGPLLPEEALSHREFAMHIDAAGEFLWRQRAMPQLLAPLRRRILQRLRSTMSWEDPTRTESNQWTVLANRTGLSPQRVQDALLADPGREPHRFVEICRDLNTLEHYL